MTNQNRQINIWSWSLHWERTRCSKWNRCWCPIKKIIKKFGGAIVNGYEIYLQEHEFDINDELELVTYKKLKLVHISFLARCKRWWDLLYE